MFTKVVSSPLEIELQKIAASYGFAPHIRSIDGLTVEMDSINGMSVADLYGEDPAAVPDSIWAEIRRILAVLYENEEIEYVDITAYNFMVENGTEKVWIIDFGHAYYAKKINWCLKDVLEGAKGWNTDFA
jgi:tRNA A-37 threonylcarbamoyl transferase component Bud32